MSNSLIYAHDVASADHELLLSGGLWAYLWVGAKHMLTGYDHLLFLIGVVFYLSKFSDIIKFISAFTLGHSITLIAATFLKIEVNEYLIDAVIGFSVFYKGFENLGGFKTIGGKAPNLLLMVTIFGLIHGLGLSARLQSLHLGEEQVLLKILSFNLGVELGQVVALIPILYLIKFLRSQKAYDSLYKAINSYLLIAGLALLGYQLYQYFV
ncbi:MAG: HupE/UreJ family protein [Flavobacteriaceae bacterium]|nr:HupE/UreJ family protein [Flavobacteriaceae bacterium]